MHDGGMSSSEILTPGEHGKLTTAVAQDVEHVLTRLSDAQLEPSVQSPGAVACDELFAPHAHLVHDLITELRRMGALVAVRFVSRVWGHGIGG